MANIEVTGLRAAAGWSVSWTDPNVTRVANSWGISCTVLPKVSVTCSGSDWATKVAAGLASARARWADHAPRSVRLDELPPDQRRLVKARVAAARAQNVGPPEAQEAA